MNTTHTDVIVVGGGLAGLTAAAIVAKAGRKVIVLDQASHLGGRAITNVRDGIHFNIGPHALYCHGDAFRLMKELGVPFSGRFPSPGRAVLTDQRNLHPLPQTTGSLHRSRLLTWREKWKLARLQMTLPRLDCHQFDRVPLRHWLDQEAGVGGYAELLKALFRVSSYVNNIDEMSASVALNQLKLALMGNVWYLDGGWQTLVDGLRKLATTNGARVQIGAQVNSITDDEHGVTVRLADGEFLRSRTAILAVAPKSACELLNLPHDSALAQWTAAALPVRAACLDVALNRLPLPELRFALGLDNPLYFSVHSAAAKLAPDGVVVLHAMKYLASGESPSKKTERELEAFMDRLQPGWREHVIDRRFLPAITVVASLPRASEGGLAGRPGVQIAGHPNVFPAGDWVGPRGWLADAAAASAEQAANGCLAALNRPERSLAHASC